MNILPDERCKRFVAVLNKKIEIGKLLNALGHMTAGLAGSTTEEMCFIDYTDRDGAGVFRHLSFWINKRHS